MNNTYNYSHFADLVNAENSKEKDLRNSETPLSETNHPLDDADSDSITSDEKELD